MNRKAAPILLVAAALAIVAAVILTTPSAEPPITGEQDAAPVAAETRADASGFASDSPSRDHPAPAMLPQPAPSYATATVATPATSGVTTSIAADPGREPRPAKAGEPAEAPGNVKAEMAVAQALAAAGLSTADIQIATLGAAPAAATAPETPEAATGETAPPTVRTTRNLTIPVPTGAKVPVVFYDNQTRPLPQQQALDRIAAEFSDTISNPPAGYTQQEVWEAARKIADERYAVLYGFDAFNQMSMHAAKEALKEKKAASAQAATP